MGLFVCFVQCTGLDYGFHYTLCDAWKENMEYFYVLHLLPFFIFLSDSVKTLCCSIDRPFFQIKIYFKNQLTSYVYYWYEVQ